MTNTLTELRNKLPSNHPLTETALITLQTLENQSGPAMSATQIYLNLLSIL